MAGKGRRGGRALLSARLGRDCRRWGSACDVGEGRAGVSRYESWSRRFWLSSLISCTVGRSSASSLVEVSSFTPFLIESAVRAEKSPLSCHSRRDRCPTRSSGSSLQGEGVSSEYNCAKWGVARTLLSVCCLSRGRGRPAGLGERTGHHLMTAQPARAVVVQVRSSLDLCAAPELLSQTELS